MKTIEIGPKVRHTRGGTYRPYFAHFISLRKGTERYHTTMSWRAGEPFMFGRAYIFRLWGERGVVFGRWTVESLDEDEHLSAILSCISPKAFPKVGE